MFTVGQSRQLIINCYQNSVLAVDTPQPQCKLIENLNYWEMSFPCQKKCLQQRQFLVKLLFMDTDGAVCDFGPSFNAIAHLKQKVRHFSESQEADPEFIFQFNGVVFPTPLLLLSVVVIMTMTSVDFTLVSLKASQPAANIKRQLLFLRVENGTQVYDKDPFN